jgi:hypothetical protein
VNWVVKLIIPEHTTYDGMPVSRQEKEYEIPFKSREDVWRVHRKKWWKRKSPWVITKNVVTGMWATNTVGIILDDNSHISEDEFDRIFTDRTEAIEYCLKKNEYRKVKIYGE